MSSEKEYFDGLGCCPPAMSGCERARIVPKKRGERSIRKSMDIFRFLGASRPVKEKLALFLYSPLAFNCFV